MKDLPNATRSARPCAMASLARTLSKPLLAMKSPPKGRNRGPARVALDHMKISETSARQCRGDVVEQALRIAVGDVVLPVLRRDAQACAFGTNRSGHRVNDLEQEPHTVLDAASISVRALVGAIA